MGEQIKSMQHRVMSGEKVFPLETMRAVLQDANTALGERDELLRRCAAQFRLYEENHRKKADYAREAAYNGSKDLSHDEKGSLAKAEVNKKFAEEIEALLEIK